MAIIGNNTIGGAGNVLGNTMHNHYRAIDHYTAIAGDYIDRYHCYCSGDSALILHVGAYDFIGGVTTNRLAPPVNIIPDAAPGWYSSPIVNQPLVAGVTYNVGMYSNNAILVWRGALGVMAEERDTGFDFPDPFVFWMRMAFYYSIWANVTNGPAPPTTSIYYPPCAQLIT